MKKTILFFIFAGLSFCAFSQTIKVEKGKAVQITPAVAEQKTVLTKEQILEKKSRLNQEIFRKENEISRLQKELSDLKVKLTEIENVCDKLKIK